MEKVLIINEFFLNLYPIILTFSREVSVFDMVLLYLKMIFLSFDLILIILIFDFIDSFMKKHMSNPNIDCLLKERRGSIMYYKVYAYYNYMKTIYTYK